jgi:ketosteroid isomerase-like protein
MKRILFLLLFVSTTTLLTSAQSKQETAVTNATEQLRKAMVDGDKVSLENLVTEQLSYGHSGGHVDDKKEFVAKLTGGGSDFVTIDLTEQTVSVSGKTAIVRHILTAKTNDNGKPADVHLRVLLVWQKQGSQWKLLARQAVKIV